MERAALARTRAGNGTCTMAGRLRRRRKSNKLKLTFVGGKGGKKRKEREVSPFEGEEVTGVCVRSGEGGGGGDEARRRNLLGKKAST